MTVHAGYVKILGYEGRFTKYHLKTVFFLFPVCLQGEVVEFIDEFLDVEEPILESPPKDWRAKQVPTLLQLIFIRFFLSLIDYCVLSADPCPENLSILCLISIIVMTETYSTVVTCFNDNNCLCFSNAAIYSEMIIKYYKNLVFNVVVSL